MAADNAPRTLQDLLDGLPNPNLVDYFHNDTTPPHSRDVVAFSPVPMEYTNWRDEQRAWRETAVIFDQSHHMPEMFITGPDAFRFLEHLSINSFKTFKPGMAKQYVACNSSGYVIGDAVLFYHQDGSFELVSGMTLHDWVEFKLSDGAWDVTIERDLPTSLNAKGRRKFRFGFDGPFAETVFQEVVEGAPVDIPFFRHADLVIAGCKVNCLRHGMAGHKGVEISGAYADGARVKAALLAAGRKHGVLEGGRMAYFSSATESGWMAYPTPAIYTNEDMRPFREWLPARCWEAHTYLAGSYVSDRIEDYYNTPWELGYHRLMKFDHDFIGRTALEKMAAADRNRVKICLRWEDDEVLRVVASTLRPGIGFKALNLPVVSYGFPQCDEVRDASGKLVGLSNFTGYTVNEGCLISFAYVDREVSDLGDELFLTWGEPNGGSRKTQVERHEQTTIRCKVYPETFSAHVRAVKFAGLGAGREKVTG